MVLFVGNDSKLELQGLQNTIDDEYINDADVSVTIVAEDGTTEIPLPSGAYPLVMENVEDTNGDYRVILSHDMAFEAGVEYYALITAESDDYVGSWTFKFVGRIRRS